MTMPARERRRWNIALAALLDAEATAAKGENA
jgi:hypothetical protein